MSLYREGYFLYCEWMDGTSSHFLRISGIWSRQDGSIDDHIMVACGVLSCATQEFLDAVVISVCM